MNDPHVVELSYIVDHNPWFDYSDASPVDHKGEAFRIQMEDKRVSFQLREHFPTEESAREAVERYIRSWELKVALREGPGTFRLIYDKAKIVDRNPLPPPAPRSEPPRSDLLDVSATFTAGAGSMSANATLTAPQPKPYPQPPSRLTLDPDDPDAMTMYNRFTRYLLDREPLTGMAYFCLNMLEKHLSENREAAAKKYGIDFAVLNKIGELTAKKGGRIAARKASGIDADLTTEESRFLEEAVKAIIRRVAEVALDNPENCLRKITLSDLPKLSH